MRDRRRAARRSRPATSSPSPSATTTTASSSTGSCPGFVIQGGDPDGTGSGGPGYAIEDDPLTATYRRGTVAMARTAEPGQPGLAVLHRPVGRRRRRPEDPRAVPVRDPRRGDVGHGRRRRDRRDAEQRRQPGNAALDPVAMTRVTVVDGPATVGVARLPSDRAGASARARRLAPPPARNHEELP